MKQKNLYLMCGIPGSGKSTWITNRLKMSDGIHISRDAVRFSLLGDNDDYFSQEDEVFALFIRRIQAALNDDAGPSEIYVDATHLNEKSRNRVLNLLALGETKLIYVFFNVPLEVCLERNELRNGRAYVPKSAIRRMYFSLEEPSQNEKYPHETMVVNAAGRVVKYG